MKRTLFILTIFAFLLIACGESADGGAPITWIDKPLPNMQYLIEPIDLLIHANAKQGVTAVAFSVNGQLVEALPISGKTSPFVTLPHFWTPPAAGTYTLSFAAQDVNGTWGKNSEVTIQVVTQFADPLEGIDLTVDDELLSTTTAEESTPPPVIATTSVLPTATHTSTSVPPTFTLTPLPPTPTHTNTSPPPDTQNPVILELEWDPISPQEQFPVYFNVTAQDNVAVTRIEIYFVRQTNGNSNPVHVCNNSDLCSFDATNGFTWGTYSYYAIAYDAAGNNVRTFTQTVEILQVVK